VSLAASVRAMPTMLRVGLAETIAYRAEMIVWILTTTMPLVMLALWTSVAAEAPFREFTQADFVAYYLAALVVRNLTSNWVAWQMMEEIRTGTLSMRLLRPVHPLAGYFATQAAGLPLRAVVVLPVAIALGLSAGGAVVVTSPSHLALFAASLVGAWLLTFLIFVTLGALSFYLEKSMALVDLYFGLFMVLSGYLIPLELMPDWCRTLAAWLPFRYMLGGPVELLVGRHVEVADGLRLLAAQWAWIAGMAVIAATTWRRGLRRFEAYGA
jgi:ABC-2 type transport system permease protein